MAVVPPGPLKAKRLVLLGCPLVHRREKWNLPPDMKEIGFGHIVFKQEKRCMRNPKKRAPLKKTVTVAESAKC